MIGMARQRTLAAVKENIGHASIWIVSFSFEWMNLSKDSRKYKFGKILLCANSEPSVTTFCEKNAQFCQKIAQNGALVNKNFFPKKFLVKIWEF
jgi:hypothetical protein